ncbi:response regulator [Sphingomonas sp. CGMCC 1.13654]|uniref:Response regulator n=1 Tax=Sphingomonas chungangi TaxID=2683589 RepID=A0A838L6U8_9SPHN|nr:response regulator [Sphingomonas chungangi]MBA2934767.1 response regulator [Sphingomonas chungangi]
MPNRYFILVVDDEPANRALAAGILGAAGWQVHEADSGDRAIAAVREQRYDLILMDIQMPGRDGFETARAIRSGVDSAASVPILAFTTVPPGDAIERARAAGMDGHIAKPFTPETLVAATNPWRPSGGPFPAASLVAIFGEAEIAKLLDRFRTQLAEALAAEDTPVERKARAHKIAGISGTLGFAEVSRLWLAVSEGYESAWEEARAAARRAIHRIDTDTFGDQTAV